MLSDDQEVARAAIHAVMGDGARRLTMSGPAGSGKTTLMRTLIDDLEGKGRAVTLLAGRRSPGRMPFAQKLDSATRRA